MAIKISSNNVTYGYSRLKNIFKHGINYEHYDKMVETCKNKTVGNLPSELLTAIIRNHPENKADAIKGVQQAFADSAALLTEYATAKLSTLERFKPTIENAAKIVYGIKNHKVYCCEDELFEQQCSTIRKKAEKVLAKNLKKYLPELKSVKLDYAGSGCYADVHKCKFTGKNNQDLIPPLVIKTYKDPSLHFENKLINKYREVLYKFRIYEILEYAKENHIPINFQSIHRAENFIEFIDIPYNINPKEFVQHGILAEANTSAYIKYVNGHKIHVKDGLTLADMYSFGKQPYSVGKYISEDMQAKSEFPFDKLGLKHTDKKPDNSVNGIVLDIGGVVPMSDGLVGDIECTRLLKRYFAQPTDKAKFKFLKDIETQAKTLKDELQKRKYLKTVQEIRQNYPLYIFD